MIDTRAQTHPMSPTVRQLMHEQAARLVGRDVEQALLRQLLGEGGPLVVFIHGIAGVGKSALTEAFAVEARASGATVAAPGLPVRSNPRSAGSSPRSKTRLGGELATAGGRRAAGSAASGSGSSSSSTPTKCFRILDPWLRQAFVPALTDQRAGRPVRAGCPDDGLAERARRPFPGPPAREPAAGGRPGAAPPGRVTDQRRATASTDLARGHPLSLQLAASAVAGATGRQPRGRDRPGASSRG